MLAHPKAGASFESFCVEQILLHAHLHDPAAQGALPTIPGVRYDPGTMATLTEGKAAHPEQVLEARRAGRR